MERFKKLLVYAGTDQPDHAISRSVVLAMENEATLTLIDVIKPVPRVLGFMTDSASPKEMERLLVEDHRRKLLERAAEFSDTGVRIDVMVRVGDPATEMIREVLHSGIDLVINSAEHLRDQARFFGGIARSLLRLCPCAVLMLKESAHGDFGQVVAAIDVDASDKPHQDLNYAIAELSLEIARQDEAQLNLVTVWDDPMEMPFRQRAGDAEVDAAIQRHEAEIHKRIAALLGVPDLSAEPVQVHIRRGSAARVIEQVVEEVRADLLVMGTVCRTGVAGFLIGNTAEAVLGDVSCSVLALKPDGFVCPLQAGAEGARRED
jgi:nucleotide-binding universal stress UspA family protein